MFRRYFSILSFCLLATDATATKESKTLLRRELGSPRKVECTPYQVLGSTAGQEAEISKWMCETRAEDEGSRTPLVYDIAGLDQSYFKNEGIVSGKDSITMERATKSRGAGKVPYTITVQPGSGVTINRGRGRGNRGRRLAATTGVRKVLVVRVTSPDSTPEKTATELANDCFGIGVFADTVQLKSQFNACSGGKYQPGPTANNATAGIKDGVVDVTISINAVGVLALNTVENAARTAATSKYYCHFELFSQQPKHDNSHCLFPIRVDKVGALSQFDHIVFTWTQYSDWQGAAAYAYVNGDVSCFRDTYIWQMGVQVHEFGHNLGLSHSGENVTYDDWTCMMGNVRYILV
jgi:hypothetical protein